MCASVPKLVSVMHLWQRLYEVLQAVLVLHQNRNCSFYLCTDALYSAYMTLNDSYINLHQDICRWTLTARKFKKNRRVLGSGSIMVSTTSSADSSSVYRKYGAFFWKSNKANSAFNTWHQRLTIAKSRMVESLLVIFVTGTLTGYNV